MKYFFLSFVAFLFSLTTYATIGPINGILHACSMSGTILTDTTAGGIWTSSNPAVAAVGSTSGIVIGYTPGTANIFYTIHGVYVTAVYTVYPLPSAIKGRDSVCKGLTTTFVDTSAGGQWSSSNSFIATVGSISGLVTGVASGSATIYYYFPATGCSAQKSFTVNPLPAAIVGPNVVYSATSITLADATPGGVWTSSNSSLATVNGGTGLVTGVSSGALRVYYTLPATGCNVFVRVEVNPLPDSGLVPPIVAWYPFCADTVDPVNGHDLINSSSTTTPAIDTNDRFGAHNAAKSFNGVNTMMFFSTFFPNSGPTGDFTYSCWIYPYTAQQSIILYNGDPALNGFGFVMDNLPTGGGGSGIYGAGPGTNVSVLFAGHGQYLPTAVPLNTWTNLTLVKNGGSYKFDVNFVTTGFFIDAYNPQTEVFALGLDYNSSLVGMGPPRKAYNGKLDDIAIYNKQLSNLERGALINFNPDAQAFSLGNDTVICSDSITLAPNPQTISSYYAWSTLDSIDTAITVSPSSGFSGSQYILVIGKTFGCYARDTINVYKALIPVHLGPDATLCRGDTLTLTGGYFPGAIFHWSINDTDTSHTIRVTTSGTYRVVVDSGVCVGRDTINVQISPVPLVDLGPDQANCYGNPVTLRTAFPNPAYTYLWSDFLTTADSFVALATGNYWLSVNDSGCVRGDTVHVLIVYDTVHLITKDTAICRGDPPFVPIVTINPIITYQWTPTAGIPFSNIPEPSITPDTSAYYVLKASYPGCPDILDSFFLDVQPVPQIFMGGNRAVCQYDTIHITPVIVPQWYTHYRQGWSPGKNLADSTTSTVVFTAYTINDSTILKDTVTTPHGCRSIDSIAVIVHPGSYLVGDTSVFLCPNDSIQLMPRIRTDIVFDPPAVASFNWSPSTYLDDSTSAAPWVHPITDVSYRIIGTSQFGCLDTLVMAVKVAPAAIISLGDSVSVHPGSSYHIPAQSNCEFFSWTPELGINDSNSSNPIVTPAISTMYIVHATTTQGCLVIDSVKINVDPLSVIDIPNAFVPGNGPNNLFKIVKKGLASLNYFTIYDRWGVKVFDTRDINAGWDGTLNGKPQPMGVYVYEIEAITDNGTLVQRQGNVTLIQ